MAAAHLRRLKPCSCGQSPSGTFSNTGHRGILRLLDWQRLRSWYEKASRFPKQQPRRLTAADHCGFRFLALALASVGLAACSGSSGGSSLRRTTADREDDFSGPQIHFVYAAPAGRRELDHHHDTDGTLANSIFLLVAWFHEQLGSPILRVDIYQRHPDITYVRLPRSDQAYEQAGPTVLSADVVKAIGPPRHKLYAIFYDGTLPASEATTCGLGNGAPRPFAIVFVAQECFDNYDFSHAGYGSYNRLVFVMAHELVHELGFIPTCSLHSTNDGHVTDSRRDLMYPYLGDKTPELDVNHDDYYRAHVRGCPDLGASPYLAGSAASLRITP